MHQFAIHMWPNSLLHGLLFHSHTFMLLQVTANVVHLISAWAEVPDTRSQLNHSKSCTWLFYRVNPTPTSSFSWNVARVASLFVPLRTRVPLHPSQLFSSRFSHLTLGLWFYDAIHTKPYLIFVFSLVPLGFMLDDIPSLPLSFRLPSPSIKGKPLCCKLSFDEYSVVFTLFRAHLS